MKPRIIALILLVGFAAFITGIPRHPQPLHAVQPPPFTGGTAIWLPYVTNAAGYDTGFSVQGNSSTLETPYIHLYFYDSTGECYDLGSANPGVSTTCQWGASLAILWASMNLT